MEAWNEEENEREIRSVKLKMTKMKAKIWNEEERNQQRNGEAVKAKMNENNM
jgi:hypothetical protein